MLSGSDRRRVCIIPATETLMPANYGDGNTQDHDSPPPLPSNDFEQLERALDLYASVEATRHDTQFMSREEEELTCAVWVCRSRALLEEPLTGADRRACRWVLQVVRAKCRDRFYVHGLSLTHQAHWRRRARDIEKELRAAQRVSRSSPPKKSTIPEVGNVLRKMMHGLDPLAGTEIVIIGGEADEAILCQFQEADFTLTWVDSNVRQVQAAVERIRKGKVNGVVFLVDLNCHPSFYRVRSACRSSRTLLVLGTKGLSSICRALRTLAEGLLKASA
jgi:hypothetical protein